MIGTLGLAAAEANEILRDAGFTVDSTVFGRDGADSQFFRSVELDGFVARFPWPSFVVNERLEIVTANEAASAVWDIDFEHERRVRAPVRMSLISVASDAHFADRVVNWQQCVEVIVAQFKTYNEGDLDSPSPSVSAVLAEFAKGDPSYLARLIDIFERAAPTSTRIRWDYPVIWDHAAHGRVRFLGVVTPASMADGLAFNDWHPIDSESWAVLERVKLSHNPRAKG